MELKHFEGRSTRCNFPHFYNFSRVAVGERLLCKRFSDGAEQVRQDVRFLQKRISFLAYDFPF